MQTVFQLASFSPHERLKGMSLNAAWTLGALAIGLASGWLIRHYFKTPGFKSDTTRFFRQSASNVRSYSPVVSRGFLWVLSGVFVVILKQLLEWKANGGHFDELDLKILWFSIGATAVDKSLTYMDTTVARFKDERKRIQSNNTQPPLG